MAESITPQDLENVKEDIEDIGQSSNERMIINPRYGAPYKSIPLLSDELQAAIEAAAAAGAGSNGWTDLLIQTADGTTQRAKNTSFQSQINAKPSKDYVDAQDANLQSQIDQKATAAYLDNALAEQTQTVNTALSQLSTTANKFYPTLAEANADIANIEVNQPIQVGESGANGGLYYKATSGATSLTKSPYDPLSQSKSYTDDSLRTLEINKPQNPNKFTLDQVLFETMPTSTTGTATVVTRNGIKQLKLVSATTGGSIVAYWDFNASLFTREFAASICIEGLPAGRDGLFGIQQLNSSGTVIASNYGLTSASAAIDKQTLKANATGVAVGAAKIRLIVNMQTDTTREMYLNSPFLADGTNTNFISPPLEIDLSNIETDLSVLQDAFEYIAVSNKNIFNPALAEDAKTLQYTNGAPVTYATGIITGKHAVEAGKTYTLSIKPDVDFAFFPVIYTYTSDEVYLGIDHSIPSAGELVNANPPTNIIYSDANKTVTFTIPSGSVIAKIQLRFEYKAHTSTDFDTLKNSIQLEIGASKTEFEQYQSATGVKLVLKEDALPNSGGGSHVSDISRDTFTVTISGTDAYIRTKFSETLDLVQQVRYGTNNVWLNNVINPWSVRTIAKSTAKEGVVSAFASGTLLVTQEDDAAPLNYNGTYIGANHGAYVVHQVTANSHGKTFADVGSSWTLGANTWTIIRVVDTNTLWLLSQNTGADAEKWQFVTTLISGTLVHSVGATNISSFSVSSDVLTQLYPAINNHSKRIIVNGYRELSGNGVYDVESIEFVDSYDIMNPVSILSYLQSRVGTATEQNLSVDSIASDVRVSVNYRYALNGSCTVSTQLHKKANINFSFAGLVQANPLNYSGKTLIEYANKMKPVTVGGTPYDLSATVDATTNTALISMLKADWLDATNPPDRVLNLVKNGANKEFGQVLGYSLIRGATKPSVRQNTTDAGFFNNPTTKKVYPKALVGNLDTVVNAVAYRAIYNPAVLPQATVYTWYEDNDEIFVVLDIHQSAPMLKLPLPAMFNGKSAEVVDAHANFTLHSEIVSDGGLLCSVAGGYASVVIRLI